MAGVVLGSMSEGLHNFSVLLVLLAVTLYVALPYVLKTK